MKKRNLRPLCLALGQGLAILAVAVLFGGIAYEIVLELFIVPLPVSAIVLFLAIALVPGAVSLLLFIVGIVHIVRAVR